MIFEGTWEEGVWTSIKTISEMYDAFENGKIPVLHIPAYEYESLGSQCTDEVYVSLNEIKETTETNNDSTLTYYSYSPYEITIGGASHDINVDDLTHLRIAIS